MRGVIAGLALVALGACVATSSERPPPPSLDPGAVGFAFSPPSSEPAGVEAFFDRAASLGQTVAWVGPWTDLDRVGTVMYDQAVAHGLAPVIVIGFPDGPDGVREVPTDAGSFVESVSAWVEEHPIPLLGIGVETDTAIYEVSHEAFDRYVDLFARTADAVHAVSPDTRLFPGFQLERIRGLRGGLYGGETGADRWSLTDRFPKADLIGFSTYPGLIFTSPNEIPDDYFSQVAGSLAKPLVFTEIGWQAGGELGPWTGSDAAQAEFISDWLPQITASADVAIWSFLWDPVGAPSPFDTMGLIDGEGSERMGLSVWEDAVNG